MMLALIAVARGVFGISTTQQPRYVYEGVVFVLLAVSALLGRRAATVPKSPTGGVVLASIVTLTLVAVVRNVGMLDGGAAYLVEAAGDLRAVVALTERYGPEQLNAPPPAMKTWYIPAPKDLVRIMARYGRLDDDVFRPTVVVPTTPAQRDRALWRVLGGTVLPSPTSPPTGAPPVNGGGQPPPRILMATGPLTLDGGCLLLEGPSVTVEGSVTVIGPGAWTIGLGRESNPQPVDFLDRDHRGRVVPDLGARPRRRCDLQVGAPSTAWRSDLLALIRPRRAHVGGGGSARSTPTHS